MQLYNVYENGVLRKVKKVDFADHKVFLIDDTKTIYLWFGQKSSQKKRDLSKKKANNIIKERKKKTNLEIMYQNKEYGTFLTIKDVLKEGIQVEAALERRSELKIKIGDTMELIEAGIELDFEAELTLNAHKLIEEKKTYEELCLILAELQLKLIKGKSKLQEGEINKKAKEIHQSSSTYNELCWLIAELKLLKQNKNNP